MAGCLRTRPYAPNEKVDTHMYLEHFGLEELPFETTSNARIFIDLPNHQEALNTILFGLETGEGFVKIVGEVGTGKTALCRRLLASLPAEYARIYLPNPTLKPLDLLKSIADELEVEIEHQAGMHELQKAIRTALIAIARNNGRVILCVDEAQAISKPSLEELRLLSNLESNHGKLAQVILFGQPELDEKLSAYSLRQLQQRIAFTAQLGPLDRKDCRHYIERRLRESGARGTSIFTPAAIERIFRGSGGIPRLINILCHKSLLAAFAEGDYQVGRRHTARALSDTEGIQRWQTRPLAGLTFANVKAPSSQKPKWRTLSRWSNPQ